MSSKENNRTNKSPAKTHNIKAHISAVHIPCWLIQLPSSKLSCQAKILYGRLAKWSSANGTVYRSVRQLTEEVGMSKSTIDRTLKELRDVRLIESYQIEAGGINHYRFLEHDWMNEPINENLEYGSPYLPHTGSGVTPTPDQVLPHTGSGVPKYKEIKRNKKTTTLARENTKKSSSSDFVISEKIDKELLEDRNKYMPDNELDRTDEEFLKQCSHHLDNGDKNKYNLARRLAGLKTIIKNGFFEKPAGYDEKKIVKSLHTPEESALLYKYQHALDMVKLGAKLEDYMTDPQELKKAMELKEKYEHKPSLSKRIGGMIGFSSK